MATIIKQLDSNTISVNGKTVYKDQNSQWIRTQELTPTETKDFQNHINTTKC